MKPISISRVRTVPDDDNPLHALPAGFERRRFLRDRNGLKIVEVVD